MTHEIKKGPNYEVEAMRLRKKQIRNYVIQSHNSEIKIQIDEMGSQNYEIQSHDY